MKWRKAVILTALAVLLIETAGCKANRFATYSQDEKKEYIAEKLNDRYQISCEFSEVEKRVVDVFRHEDDYFTTAHTKTGDRFNVWIDDDGNMTDTYRLIMEKEQINITLTQWLQSELSGYRVLDFPIMEEKPEREWFDERIEEAIKEEEMEHLIYLLTEDVHKEDIQVIERVFADLDGNVYIDETEHPEQFSSIEELSALTHRYHLNLNDRSD